MGNRSWLQAGSAPHFAAFCCVPLGTLERPAPQPSSIIQTLVLTTVNGYSFSMTAVSSILVRNGGVTMKTFIFDIDGTLLDSVTMYLLGLQKTMRRHGQEFTLDELRFSNGIPSTVTMGRLGFEGDAVAPAVKEWTQDSLDFVDDVDWFPGMKDTLVALRAAGAKTGIVTSKNRDQYSIDDQRFGFSHYFDTIVGAGEAKRNKPFGDPILLAMQRVGGDVADTVYVGDTATDAQAAHDAKVAFALATWTTPQPGPEFDPIAARLQTPADLKQLL